MRILYYNKIILFISFLLGAQPTEEPLTESVDRQLFNLRLDLKIYKECYKIRNCFSDAIKMHYKDIPSFKPEELTKFSKYRKEFIPTVNNLTQIITEVEKKEKDVKGVLDNLSNKVFPEKINFTECDKNLLKESFDEFINLLEKINKEYDIIKQEDTTDDDVADALSNLGFLCDCNTLSNAVVDKLHSMDPANKVYTSLVELDKLYKSLEKLEKTCKKYI